MHRILFALVLLLITASGANAQAVQPNSASLDEPTPVQSALELRMPLVETTPVSAFTVTERETAAETTATGDVSARNIFAIVGVVVVVVALIALLS